MPAATSIFARKLDLAYVAWFGLHLTIMFAVDLVPLYPEALQAQPLLDLRQWYIATYRDRFFTHPPAWFRAYAWLELVYHVPVSWWAVGALINDDPKVPIHLLVWAVETAVTTMTCIVEFMAWPGLSAGEAKGLMGLYLPYGLLAVFMGGDMFWRLLKAVEPRGKAKKA